MKRFLAAAVSAAILFSVAGCGNEGSVPAADSSTAESVTVSSEGTAADSEEEEIKVLKAAVLSRNAARMWLLAGGEIVASVEEAQNVGNMPKNVIMAGTEAEPAIDDLLKEEPDVIIADRTVAGYTNIRRMLSDVDCEVIEVGANSFGDYDSSMKLLTERIGNEEAYARYVEEVAGRKDSIISSALEAAHKVAVTVTESPGRDLSDEKVSDEAGKNYYKGRIPTYMVIRSGEENCCAMSNDDFICSMLNDFGMTNANKSGQDIYVWKMEEDSAQSFGEADKSESSKVISETTDESGQAESPEAPDESGRAESPEAPDESGQAESPKTTDESGQAESPKTTDESETAVDTFAGEIDARESVDAGRRTFDNLLTNNPDFIFIINEGDEKTASSNCNELVKSCDSWKKIYAVQSGRVYDLPQSSFRYQPDEMWDLAYEYLYQTIFNF